MKHFGYILRFKSVLWKYLRTIFTGGRYESVLDGKGHKITVWRKFLMVEIFDESGLGKV